MRLALVAALTPAAQKAKEELQQTIRFTTVDEADVIVALGGDGFMLRTLHHHHPHKKPVFGLNCGSVGFLLNRRETNHDLLTRIQAATLTPLYPLRMTAETVSGTIYKALAINEVSLFRQTFQAAHLGITVDGTLRIKQLMCDGVLVATPAGSTAYNLSVHGPIIPIGTRLLALTPISAFRPRRWRGALLPDHVHIDIEVLDPIHRSVSATADNEEVRDVRHVSISQEPNQAFHLLFDPDHNLEERILSEQFTF